MQERYRNDYDGEFVILNTFYKDGKKQQEKEWVANPIENQHISARAAVIGHGESRENFNLLNIQDHRGGLLGKKRLQVYGSEGCWREMRCDFYVENDPKTLKEIIRRKYSERSVVYTGVKNLVKHPGEFYLIPYGVKLIPVATAMFLAAFDGHREVFLLGVDGTLENNQVNDKHIAHINQVLTSYKNTKFYFVTDRDIPEVFRKNINVEIMGYRKFISYCDV